MNKGDLVAAVADKADLNKSQAGAAVDAVLEAITSSLKSRRRGSPRRLRHLPGERAPGRRGAQPAHGRDHQDQGLAGPEVQGRRGLKSAVNAESTGAAKPPST